MASGRKTGGRKRGTPNKATASLREAAQQYTNEALAALVDVMRNDTGAAKVAAAREILDRGYGKPSQTHDVNATTDATLTLTDAGPLKLECKRES
jgi:phage gp46-like protein